MTGPPTPKVPTNDTIFLGARTSSEQQRSDCSDTPAARIALTGQPASWHPANSLNYLDRQSIDYRGCSQHIDADGNRWSMTYDSNNFIHTIKTPRGFTTS